MSKKNSLLVGFTFVFLGGLILAGNLILPALGFQFRWWQVWRLWPVFVVAIGFLMTAAPFLFRTRRGLGGLFIPGVPILVTGSILLFCSLLDAWGAWAFLWPLEPLALALGFAFAGVWLRVAGLAFPAIILGLNGLVLAFCNLTGWWEAWAVLWAIEPLAVGLSLLVLGVRQSSRTLIAVGLGFCGFASVAVIVMSTLLLTGWWMFRLFWPLAFIFVGLGIIGLGWLKNQRSDDDNSPSSPEILPESTGA